MAKKSFIFIFILLIQSSCMIVLAKEDETMQIIANKVDQNGTIITANGDILVFSPNYFITAQKAIYDQNSSTLELFGNVNISKDKQNISLSNYAFLDMKNEINSAKPVLLIDKSTNVWISAKTIEKTTDLNLIKDATISSCDCTNPTWSVGFSSGDFNTTDQWINTYNNTLYIHDIPAWYFLIPAIPYITVPTLAVSYLMVKMPYMGFSTNKERKTGLLRPQFGYGQTDGWLYAQPIYYAPRKDIDFEYIPQIRTSRGNGQELIVRYADSEYSKLDFNAGIFNEKESYFHDNNLINQKHYGWNLKYDRRKLFSTGEDTDGFYTFLQDMNDIEYLNTKYNRDNEILYADKLLESKIKYFYNTQSYNINSEVLDYNNIDYNSLGQENNDATVMQVTPAVGLHLYSNKLFFDKLRNSVDVKYKRQQRKTGLGAETTELTLPFLYSKSFLNDYLLFSYEKFFGLNTIQYLNNNNHQYKDGYFLNTKDSISLEMDLLKSFETKIHTVNLNVKYSKPRHIKEEGSLYSINSKDSNLSIFPFSDEIENINISFNQSLFNKENLSTIVNHKVNQKIIYDTNGTSTLDNLENELTVYLPYISVSNRSLYNHDEKMVIDSTSSLRFLKDNYFADLDYSFQKDKTNASEIFLYKDLPNLKSITGNIGTKVLKYYTLGYKEQYDLTNHISKFKEYKVKIDKKCWALDLSFQDSLVATAITTDKAKRQSIVYATITLKPILSFSQKYIQDAREE
jgi:LPS-assembly protein